MLHKPPLPPRHPQDPGGLAPGASMTWRIVLQPAATLDDVPKAVAAICRAPAIALDRTTAAPGETFEATVIPGGGERPEVRVVDAAGRMLALGNPLVSGGAFHYEVIAPETGRYDRNKPTWPDRPQNTSWMLGLLVARYAATRDVKRLEAAADWADNFIKDFQLPSGAYQGYTAVTLGAKFLRELAWFERPLASGDPVPACPDGRRPREA